MPLDLDEFHAEFFQDVLGSADAEGEFVEDAFFDSFCEYLIDAGEFDTADRARYNPRRGGLRVDGYGGDPASAGGTLSLIVSDFNQSPAVGRLTGADMDAMFKRATNFLEKALDPRFRHSLEENDPGFGLADLIAKRWAMTNKVRIFLISNRVLSNRVDGRDAGEHEGVPISYSVWDMGRLHRFAGSGFAREEIVIDLERDFGGSLQALPAHLNTAGYEAYLVVIPGRQLAAIYDKWGARLLEQNVRVFLQARAGVNKGIRATLENDPEMFFAYNNGVTATAEGVETRDMGGRLVLTGLRNLQIVNGGQTMASIHVASRRKDIDLSKVFVQMKLSIVEPARAIDIVPKISEFANTQNRVNAADFFANHPFHVRMEEFSRRTFAPSPDGSFKESKWFYERARGQYQDARALLTPAQRRKFDLEYPKSQLIEKTDFAKFINPWKGLPDLVSKGSQKNFAEFAKEIGRHWAKQADDFNEAYYRQASAKAIAFRETEKIVSRQPWYQGGGIRSRVVPYALAKLSHDAERHGRFVDFDAIWRSQKLSLDLTELLTIAAEAVHGVIVGAASEIPNPLEWAKQQACWSRTQALHIDWPEGWLETLVTSAEAKDAKKSAAKDQKLLNGIQAQTSVYQSGADFWAQIREWGAARKLLAPADAGVLDVAASMPMRLPTEKQAVRALEVLKRLHAEGCQLGL